MESLLGYVADPIKLGKTIQIKKMNLVTDVGTIKRQGTTLFLLLIFLFRQGDLGVG